MIWILYALAFFWIAAGAIFILYTEESRRFLKNSMGRVKPKFLAPMGKRVFLVYRNPGPSGHWKGSISLGGTPRTDRGPPQLVVRFGSG
jgi:hypothetical protein